MANNCQIPTPVEYVRIMLDYAGYQERLFGKKVLENSCGEGNILCEIVSRYIENSIKEGHSEDEIAKGLEKDIEGFEIDKDKIAICTSNLNAILKKFNIKKINWNIHKFDYLRAKKKKYDFIIGNPPYITYHDMDEKQRIYLKKEFKSCERGRFDYCYAFIEKSLNSLKKDGTLVYLVPYSILKNKFASGLREILLPYVIEICDYRGIRIFSEAITSSIILICRNQKNGENIQYFSVLEDKKEKYNCNCLGDKWLFDVEVNKKERKFGDYFEVCNSIATLLNEAFLLADYKETKKSILLNGYKIEKEITYPAISTKSLNKSKNGKAKELLIIFPYDYKNGKIKHYDEKEFQKKFPETFRYLQSFRKKLDNRKKDTTAKWFEYGRSQAISRVFGEKLILPMVITNSVKTYCGKQEEIPYAGYFIKCRGNSEYKLQDAKRILESKEFYDYVKSHGTPTTTTSYRISVNDIKEYKF